MATVTYTFVSRCPGGGHTTINVNFNGINLGDFVYNTDELRAPLAQMPQEIRELTALNVLKIHLQGLTRPQVVTEFGSPVVVTI